MSKVDKLANQPISDALIDELTDLLHVLWVRREPGRLREDLQVATIR
jgi:hypothetical protein